MPLTITIEGKGVIANADAFSDSAGGVWNEDGSGTDSFTTFTYQMGGVCFAGAYSNKAGYQYFDIGAGNELDFTPVTGAEAGQHIIMPVMCHILGVIETLANHGLAVRLATSLTDYREYVIAGQDDQNGWDGRWKPFMIDPTKPGTSADVGTFNIASVRYIGIYIDCSALVSGDVIFIDTIAVGKGLRITGDSIAGWQDIADYCTDYYDPTTPRAWNFVQDVEGTLLSYGKFFIGDSVAQTALVDFYDSGKNIKFIESEYWNGTIWTSLQDVDSMGIVVEDHASWDTDYEDENVNISGDDTINVDIDASNATNFILAGGAISNVNDVTVALGHTLSGKVFTDADACSIANDPLNCTWNISGQVLLTGTMTGCIFNSPNILASTAAVVVDDLTKIGNGDFTRGVNGYAVELTSIGAGSMPWNGTLSGYRAGVTGSPITPTNLGDEAIFVNVASGTLTINIGADATVPSIRSAGAIVNIVAGQSDLTFTIDPSYPDYEYRVYEVTAKGSLTGSVEVQGIEQTSLATNTYSYTHVVGKFFAVQIIPHDNDFVENTSYYDSSATDQNVTINLDKDTNN